MRKVPADHIRLTWGKQQKGRYKQSPWFKRVQILAPLLPIPVGMFLLYKAIKSYNRSPPPIATDSENVLSRPLYAEPVYQRVSFHPSTIAQNLTPRGTGPRS